MITLIQMLDEWARNTEYDNWKDFCKYADYETMMFWLEQIVNDYAIEVAQDALDRADFEHNLISSDRYFSTIKNTKIITGNSTFMP